MRFPSVEKGFNLREIASQASDIAETKREGVPIFGGLTIL